MIKKILAMNTVLLGGQLIHLTGLNAKATTVETKLQNGDGLCLGSTVFEKTVEIDLIEPKSSS